MAQEFQIAWPCSHMTYEEVVPLGSDRRSLSTRQPIASANTVRIMVNDEFFLPQSGLYTSAVLTSAISGPYDLIQGGDTLVIQSSAGSQTFSFQVTGTKRVSATDIIAFLVKNGLSVAASEAVNGHLSLIDITNVGPSSFVKVSGPAAALLGFGAPNINTRQWAARGVQLYPSWSVLTPKNEITSRIPVFDVPVRTNPMFKVSYATSPNRCLRCGGTSVENDYRFDASGQSIMIKDENLLYQAALKIILTDKGSNPYYPWYGTSIRSRIGSKAVSGVAMLISEDVRSALSKFQDLQNQQAKYQPVSFKERLYTVLGVNVAPHAQDPTTFLVDVSVQNASGDPVNLSIVFTVPGVIALMGQNGLFLGNQSSGFNQTNNLTLRI